MLTLVGCTAVKDYELSISHSDIESLVQPNSKRLRTLPNYNTCILLDNLTIEGKLLPKGTLVRKLSSELKNTLALEPINEIESTKDYILYYGKTSKGIIELKCSKISITNVIASDIKLPDQSYFSCNDNTIYNQEVLDLVTVIIFGITKVNPVNFGESLKLVLLFRNTGIELRKVYKEELNIIIKTSYVARLKVAIPNSIGLGNDQELEHKRKLVASPFDLIHKVKVL